MKAFDKPALSTAEQVDLLLSRGMQVVQPQRAAKVLQHINYYRLRAYWLAFEVHSQTERNHRFADGTDFDLVVAIYNFDRELRLLVLDAVERFEISLRTRLSNELTLRYGPFAHEDGSRFTRQAVWQTGLDELRREYNRSRETFAEHYRTEYPQLTTPPLWVVSELMSIGHLSRWVQNIASPKDRQAIANAYGLDEKVLVSFAHHLTVVRNHCAHHGRVWNRKFSMTMLIPGKKPAGLAAVFNTQDIRRIYNSLAMLAYLTRQLDPRTQWPERVKALINGCPFINPHHMGFPEHWQTLSVWRENETT
jgi:abortive infection bacteriophage resistance protein